ncbi:2-amino-4-hydroxy-6-hydroxymethyldihydropteridine diphosphokinase [Sphingomonas sp. PR090111-T3T-6A]|uniref:2-amino-4-hydroxy-6- hydroxymethyldihydropteridine diphosphokinase n=1 Tax=Sphingomonas sp. PR090111-T3T-6A TaxID=685778 RepID=UPI00037EA49E|nr:2-amino-4-hydroxy-6-hydroxymethyldihydropteridine diphosphokinase [Sphingomonas sp. PR090111-T3T-6A]
MGSASYVIGLGSNRPHGTHGRPRAVLAAAIEAMAAEGLTIRAQSATLRTPALGPSIRDFANAAVLVESRLAPPDLLALLKRIERSFGRRRGRRWGARVIDLDILAWSEGAWPPLPRRSFSGRLAVPHIALPARDFALAPAAAVAPGWRHPIAGRTLRQLDARRRKPRPVDRRPRDQ